MAVASFLIELIQAQMASVLWGGVLAKYTLTMGLFILALGLGSFYKPSSLAGQKLAWQQLLMATFAILSPWIILWAGTHLMLFAAWSVSALSILVVGFIAGTEFPLLARIAEKQTQEDSSFIFSNLMSVDYLGMGLSSIVFPIFLLRHIGIFNASLLAAALNLILSFAVYEKHQDEFQSKKHQLVFLILFVLSALLIFAGWLNIDPITAFAQSWLIE